MSQYQPPSAPQQGYPLQYPPSPEQFQYQQRVQQAARHSPLRAHLAWCALGLLLGPSIGYAIHIPYSSGSTSNNIVASTSIPASSDTSTDQSATPASHSVGQPVAIGFWQATLNSVKTSHGDGVSSPKSGNIYLVIDATVVNISQTNQLLASGYYFRLTDSTGLAYDEQFTDFGSPPDGNIIPGGKLRGQLIYEVPATQRAFTLQLQGDHLGQAVAIWNISVK